MSVCVYFIYVLIVIRFSIGVGGSKLAGACKQQTEPNQIDRETKSGEWKILIIAPRVWFTFVSGDT